jgi:hypothetical protein
MSSVNFLEEKSPAREKAQARELAPNFESYIQHSKSGRVTMTRFPDLFLPLNHGLGGNWVASGA